jgi:hypothetical protein
MKAYGLPSCGLLVFCWSNQLVAVTMVSPPGRCRGNSLDASNRLITLPKTCKPLQQKLTGLP